MKSHRFDFKLAFDTEETKVYERAGKSDKFMAFMTEEEALMLKQEIDKQLNDSEP